MHIPQLCQGQTAKYRIKKMYENMHSIRVGLVHMCIHTQLIIQKTNAIKYRHQNCNYVSAGTGRMSSWTRGRKVFINCFSLNSDCPKQISIDSVVRVDCIAADEPLWKSETAKRCTKRKYNDFNVYIDQMTHRHH